MKQMHHMDYEQKEPNKQDRDAYTDFMCNPENEYNCNECPERGISSTGLPCGQQNCWVTCHCANSAKEMQK